MTPAGEEPARQALEHLQRAVLETIAAARSALDAAEALLRDPATLAGVASAMATAADAITTAMSDAGSSRRASGDRRTGEDAYPGSKVQHISVG